MVFILKAAFSCFTISPDDCKVADCGTTTTSDDDHHANTSTSISNCCDHMVKKYYSWENIKKGSRNFSKVIGSGGFSTVYLALLPDSEGGSCCLTAVKIQSSCTERLARIHDQELQILLRLKHPNIVNFVGHSSSCDDNDQKALLFEYVSNGTLHDKLVDNSSNYLTWKARKLIAFQLATALEYLHGLHIIHGDIKASNILLDQQLNCKLCDFGSAKLGFTSMVLPPSSTKMNRMMIMGSQGYMDPHYLKTGLVSKKNDIYSYGVVLLELITGKQAAFSMDKKLTEIIGPVVMRGLVGVEEVVDPRLMTSSSSYKDDDGSCDLEEVKAMLRAAAKCINATSLMARPCATEIVTSIKHMIFPSIQSTYTFS